MRSPTWLGVTQAGLRMFACPPVWPWNPMDANLAGNRAPMKIFGSNKIWQTCFILFVFLSKKTVVKDVE